jgi:tRNA-uridine 2-sulfurtransferase
MRVVVAMSGGVDSSVAAALLARAGHEVIGLSMQLYDQQEGQVRFGTCCTIDDLHDARRVAARIGIPHYIVNFERQFSETVISNFVQEYAAGRTPIPCVHCNGDLKFATLVARAQALGAELVATGHYARVDRDAAGLYHLRRGLDPARDQSYFLFTLDQAQLAHAMFPVGEVDKTTVREWARELDLPVAEKRDSHEICFVPDGDHAAFLERHGTSPQAGAIRDTTGRVVGRHDGVHHFTVGQRKGLGLSSPVPLYVVGIDAPSHCVTVGPREALERGDLTASRVNWIAGEPPAQGARITAQIRHRHKDAPARLDPIDRDRARLTFDAPQSAVAPGQAVVFYDGDAVVGGGWID